MNLKQFKYVLVLSDQKSFSRAAEELGISQPSLSQYVRKIEEELGVRLFDRSGSSLRLTDAGKAYIEAGRAILDIEQRMKGRFDDLNECRSGSVSIGVSPHRSICILPKAIAEFRAKYPGMQIIVDERVGSELLDRAEHGEYDLCITTLPVDENIFKYEPMKRDECVLAVPKGCELDRRLAKCCSIEEVSEKGKLSKVSGRSKSKENAGAAETPDIRRSYPVIDIRKIDKCDLIVLSENQVMQRILEDVCREYKININKTVVCKSLEAELALVREGIGPAFLPSGMLRDETEKISCYSFIQDIPMREIVVIYRKEFEITKAVGDFIEILKKI
ncbi:MAG: LysR family transcriptional regulator [Lachnospiraceae bacterium]|nr:LysR family transcriptional regulator [Lachnospiraceae bacterium]